MPNSRPSSTTSSLRIDLGELRDLIKGNALFGQMSHKQVAGLSDIVSELRDIHAGEFIIREGEQADNLYIIRDGAFEVLKKESDSDAMYGIASLGPGMSIGEVALLDYGARSASVRATARSSVIVIPIEKLNALSAGEESVDIRMKMNLAYELGRRLRDTNEAAVRHLQERLEEAEKRLEMGKFLSRVLVGIALYMFAMSVSAALAKVVDTTIVNIPILLGFAYGVYRTVQTSPYPIANYGFTLKDWRRNVLDALLWTVPMLAAIVGLKYVLVTVVPSLGDHAVFEFLRSKNLTPLEILLLAAAYAAFAPVQEMIARSGIQCSCQMFLTGKYRILESIILSNLLFSATHLHVGLTMALFVLPAGFFWGWLFWRQGSIVGTSVSHAIIGIFAFFVVGFDFIF